MWGLFFASDNADFDFLEPGRLEPLMHVAFGKTQPAVAVKLVGSVEFVLEQIKNHDLASRFDDFMDRGDGFVRFLGVVERLTEDRKVNAVRFDRRVLEVAAPEFEVLEIILFGFGGAKRDDFLRVVDGDDFFAAAGKEFT